MYFQIDILTSDFRISSSIHQNSDKILFSDIVSDTIRQIGDSLGLADNNDMRLSYRNKIKVRKLMNEYNEKLLLRKHLG